MMADHLDSSSSTDSKTVETSFGGSDDQDEFLNIDHSVSTADYEDRAYGDQHQTCGSTGDVLKQPRLIARIGRSVKAVGSAIGGALNKFTSESSESSATAGPSENANGDLDFVEACKIISKTLTRLHSKHGESVFPGKDLQAMMKTNNEVLEKKEICISIFGEHNCGKSTLLNAFIGEELLPVRLTNETSVKIKVQHDSNIHQGVCSDLHGSHQQSKTCPKLQVFSKEDMKEIKGAQKIYDYLLKLNDSVRKANCEPPTVVLKVYIPLLAGRVLPGWTVYLVDNPGFGDANEHVVQLADASLVTSSAYIYLVKIGSIGGTETARFFRKLTDTGALRDGRLAIGITQFDEFYCKKRTSSSREPLASVESIKNLVITSITDATGTEVTEDTVIPLCGQWALAASKLAKCLISNHSNEKLEEEAAEALESYPHFSLPGGQEQSPKEAIKHLQPMDLIDHLEGASGVSDLKERIHYVVENAGVKVWATKLVADFQYYLQRGEKGIADQCKYLANTKEEKERKYKLDQDLYNKVLSSREKIKCTAPKRKKRTALIWKEFEDNYDLDLEKYKPQEVGKLKVRDLVKEFKDQCQSKIDAKHFSPADFEKGIQVFLNESAPKLQKVFDSSCGFGHVQGVLMLHNMEMVKKITELRSNAMTLCRMGPFNDVTESCQEKFMSEGTALSEPNLADIKLRVKIPSVSLRWWEKIISFFRSLRANKSTELEQKREESEISSSSSLCNQSYNLEPDDSQSDSDVELDAISVNVNHKFVSESGSIRSRCSSATGISQAEDEIDGGSHKQFSSKQMTYRKWTKELEDAIQELQHSMEEECDKYFEVIKQRAIKFFYKNYCRKTHEHLEAFDKEFNGLLEQEHQRIRELKHEIDSLKKELDELKKINTQKLSQQLLDAYSVEFASQ